MMALKKKLLGLILLGLFASTHATDYSDRKAKVLMNQVIKAHGGLQKWANSPSISYTHDMIDPRKPEDHWLSHEIHEQGQRRCYQNWEQDDAILVNSGDEIWTVGPCG